MAVPDQRYSNFLTHLHRPTTTITLQAIQSTTTHYLANSIPYPTPFAAILVSSPFFNSKPFSHTRVQSLSTAFRHSVHVKYKVISDHQGGLFAQSPRARLRQWAVAVLKGIQGGEPVIRLACCGGLLLGLQDLKDKSRLGEGGVWSRAADEVVVALAEVMDRYAYAQAPGAWESEFHPVEIDGDALSLALILASQSFPPVPANKLKALPLHIFARLLISIINSAFQSGTFLSQLSSSVTPHKDHNVCIDPSTSFARSIHNLSTSHLMSAVGPLSKLCARTLSVLLYSRPDLGLTTISETLRTLESIAASAESDWAESAMSAARDENDIASNTRETTKTIWTVLKTLLFSTLMITDSALSTITYLPPQTLPPARTPASLALITLQTLSRLSFVISQFGSVTITSQGGFSELKKVFYSALDIVSMDPGTSERFVKELCDGKSSSGYRHDHPFQQAKNAYALASIEQLIPVLSERCIQFQVLPMCLPHLSNPVHRETYESSHSVILAIFASHVQLVDENKPAIQANEITDYRGDDDGARSITTGFAKHIIPFYANCLIENSADGQLNTPQLRLAFSTLVRSASANTYTDDKYTLAWFCIDTLLSAINTFAQEKGAEERVHRLQLTLVSTVPALSLPLLPLVLDEIRKIVARAEVESGPAAGERRRQLIDGIYEGLLEGVGDREKEFALRWWHENRRLGSSRVVELVNRNMHPSQL